MQIEHAQLVFVVELCFASNTLEQLGRTVQLLLRALQIALVPQRKTESVTYLRLVLSTRVLLRQLQALLQVVDRSCEAADGVMNATWNKDERVEE